MSKNCFGVSTTESKTTSVVAAYAWSTKPYAPEFTPTNTFPTDTSLFEFSNLTIELLGCHPCFAAIYPKYSSVILFGEFPIITFSLGINDDFTIVVVAVAFLSNNTTW